MKKAILILFLVAGTHLIPLRTHAQCAMCSRVVESNQANKVNKVGKKLNNGILYLLAVPYLIGAIGAFAWYKNRNKV